MMNEKKNDEILKRLLKKVKPDTPKSEFVDLVMEELAFEIQREKISDVKLISLLKCNGMEKPSIAFTDKLMEQIQTEVIPVKEQIISKRGWYAIFITLLLIIIAIGFSGSNNSTSNTSNVASTHFEGVGQSLTLFIAQIHSFPSVFYLVLIPICILLLMDYFLRSRNTHYELSHF